MSRRRWHRAAEAVAVWAVLAVASLTALFPIAWTALTSVKTRVDTLAVPPKFIDFEPTFAHYASLLGNPEFGRLVGVTILVTAGATVLAVTAGTLCAYVLVRRSRFSGRQPLEAGLVILRAVPGVAIAVPLYNLAITTGLYDNVLTSMVVYAALNLPFATWLMVSFIRSVHVELEECARIDGANTFEILRHIVVPLSLPGLQATTIFVALLAWNEFLIPLVLADSEARTLPVFISTFISARSIDWGSMAAAASIAILPIAVLVIAIQRHLVGGLSLGAVKE